MLLEMKPQADAVLTLQALGLRRQPGTQLPAELAQAVMEGLVFAQADEDVAGGGGRHVEKESAGSVAAVGL